MQYPSGRELSYEYNSAGQPKSVAKGDIAGVCSNGNCYAQTVTYAPHGAMLSALFGPLMQSWTYNGQLQTSGILASQGTTTRWSLTNTFDAPLNDGNIVGAECGWYGVRWRKCLGNVMGAMG